MNTYHFTQDQLISLLHATIDMYLEFRDVHEHEAEASKFEAVDEMFQGLDADRELAENDPTERLRMQLPDVAPELLAVLIELHRICMVAPHNEETWPTAAEFDAAWRRANAAIAKAHGEVTR